MAGIWTSTIALALLAVSCAASTNLNSTIIYVDIDVISTASTVPASETLPACKSNVASQQCDMEACTNDFLRERFCAHRGVTATVLAFEDDDLWPDRLEEFYQCTGGRIILTLNGVDGEGDEDSMENDIAADAGFTETIVSAGSPLKRTVAGAGVFDSYVVQPPWLPKVEDQFENLSPRISKANEYINWLDVNQGSRDAVTFSNGVRALPLDSDNVQFGWRQDVFERWNISGPPETVEELVELSEFFNGKDHNDDGEPDWGFCLTPQVNYFYAMAAPLLKAQGCTGESCAVTSGSPNLFFNLTTFEPHVENKAFQYAVELYSRLIKSSNCPDQTQSPEDNPYAAASGGKCDRKTAFPTGKCAGILSMPGTMTRLLRSIQPRVTLLPNGTTTVWEPTTRDGAHYGRRTRFPGSHRVWDAASDTLMECTTERCPFAVPHSVTGRLVNYAPFFAEGGECYGLRAAAPERKKDLMFDLFTWFSTLNPQLVPLTGIYRKSQLSSDTLDVLSRQLNPTMADDLLQLLRVYFAPDGNSVEDLIIPEAGRYLQAINSNVIQKLLLDPRNLYSQNVTWLNANLQGSLERTRVAMNAISHRHSALAQLSALRSSINLPAKSALQVCQDVYGMRSVLNDDCLLYINEVERSLGLSGNDSDDTSHSATIGYAMVGVAILLVCLVALFVARNKRARRRRDFNKKLSQIESRVTSELVRRLQLTESEGSEMISSFQKLKVDAKKLKYQDLLGSGAFGTVHKGELASADAKPLPVAIKTLKGDTSTPEAQEIFLLEAYLQFKLMAHKHVLLLFAVCIENETISTVSEHMAGGDLLRFLRDRRAAGVPVPEENMRVCLQQVASAMCFLQRNKVVHRDLAARNVLVRHDITDICIADFGMSRCITTDYYRKLAPERLPVKWMAPEAIKLNLYTHASDVWSFAILAVEIYTLGEVPWPGLGNLETVAAIALGQRPQQPEACPDNIYHMLTSCWTLDPDDRPTFYQLHRTLSRTLGMTLSSSNSIRGARDLRASFLAASQSRDGNSIKYVQLERNAVLAALIEQEHSGDEQLNNSSNNTTESTEINMYEGASPAPLYQYEDMAKTASNSAGSVTNTSEFYFACDMSELFDGKKCHSSVV